MRKQFTQEQILGFLREALTEPLQENGIAQEARRESGERAVNS